MLADFLRRRRAGLQPEDVGLPRTARRRTDGLRRDEVSRLVGMSTDYYTRLEQQRGPQPSPSMLLAMARGLRLSLLERDHLFRLAGHPPPPRGARSDHVSPGVRRVLDCLTAPAMVTNDLGETLAQNAAAVALFGDESRFAAQDPRRSRFYRWFCEPGARAIHPLEERDTYSRAYVSVLRLASARAGGDPRCRALVEVLVRESAEFAALWDTHEVTWRPSHQRKTFLHPEHGVLELDCEELSLDEGRQILLVYTATPGTPSADRLRLLGLFAGAGEVGLTTATTGTG